MKYLCKFFNVYVMYNSEMILFWKKHTCIHWSSETRSMNYALMIWQSPIQDLHILSNMKLLKCATSLWKVNICLPIKIQGQMKILPASALIQAWVFWSQSQKGWKRPLEAVWSHPSLSRDTQSRLPSTTPCSFWRSVRRETAQTLCILCQGFITHRVKKCFLLFRQNLLYSRLCPLPLVLLLKITLKIAFL